MRDVLAAGTTYLDFHKLPDAGKRSGDKVAMVECCKMALYVEPWIIWPGTAAPMEHVARFTIQANDNALPVNNDQYNIHELLDRPDVYWAHLQWMHRGAAYATAFKDEYPKMWDVSAPNGQGILFKGDVVWISYMDNKLSTPVAEGSAAYTWYCLCRTVWVDPAYYCQSTLGASTSSITG